MKQYIKSILTSFVLLLALAGSVLADSPKIYRGDFTTPNANQAGNTGDLYTGQTGGQLWIKTGGQSSTGWVQLVANGSIASTLSSNVFGYYAGSGTVVTQATSITTGVTINKPTGAITTVSSTLAAGVGTKFTVTDSSINATDTVALSVNYAGTGLPIVTVGNVGAGSFDLILYNGHATAAFNAALVINFSILRGSAN